MTAPALGKVYLKKFKVSTDILNKALYLAAVGANYSLELQTRHLAALVENYSHPVHKAIY